MKWLILAAGVLAMSAQPAVAGELRLEFSGGFVTLSAKDVPVRQILNEWARKGQTRIVNAERVTGGPVTLELSHVPEQQALDIVLRSVAGYLAAPRAVTAAAGQSSFDRILVMATSSAPTTTMPVQTGAAPVYRPPVMGQAPGSPQPNGYAPPNGFPPPNGFAPPNGGVPQPDGSGSFPQQPAYGPQQEGPSEGTMPPGYVPDEDDGDQPVGPQIQDGEVPPPPGMPQGVPPQMPQAVPGQIPQMAPGQQVLPAQPQAAPANGEGQSATPPPPGPSPFQQGTVVAPAPGQLPVPETQKQPQ